MTQNVTEVPGGRTATVISNEATEGAGQAAPGHVSLRFFAAAEAAMGTDSLIVRIDGPMRLADLLAHVIAAAIDDGADDSGAVRTVLANCSFLVNEISHRDRSVQIAPGDEIDVLPPFAGG